MKLSFSKFWLSASTFATLLVLTLGGLADDPRAKETVALDRFDTLIKPEDRQHWAFQQVHRPTIPAIQSSSRARNAIDDFVLAKLQAKGWEPSPPAAPRQFLRRLFLDLTGLPPSPAEQQAFLEDQSPEAVDRLIDELLARPSYGERWGRHWLDLVRYAETNGYERDATKPSVWRYRDYVIRAFNEDKPYDQFVLEQLAGDELPAANAETLIATGYYRLGPWDDEPANPQEDRFDQLDDMVSTTAQAFLGLTLACARCHNHKFEALTQHDYYRMVAIFNTLERPRNGRTELDQFAGTRQEVATAFGLRLASLGSTAPGTPGVSPALIASLGPVTTSRELPRGYFMREVSPRAPTTHLLMRGKAIRPGPEVGPGVPAVLVPNQPSFLPSSDSTSRRRTTLAQWIASPQNPLTARVIVNRIWQFHFGEGLVRTSSDFGTNGERPTHPELLDWLVSELIDHGWSLKRLHRLILTSNAYRMSKRWNPEYGTEDPENRLLWRFPYRRLEVEAIRDSILEASGQLSRRMYGPSMYPEVPKEALEGHSDPDKIWKPLDERDAARRTVYAFVKRSLVVPMLEVLDLCDTTRSSAQRNVTTVAPQALTLMNGAFINRQARHLAERLRREVGDDSRQQIERAYLLVLCRPSTPAETTALLTFLERETAAMNDPAEGPKRALEQMCRLLFNLNEFVYPD